MVGHRRSPPQVWCQWDRRVFPAIPYVGIFAATSRDATLLDQGRLTVFRAKGQAERTKAEHAPDKAVQKLTRVFQKLTVTQAPGDHIFRNRLFKVDVVESGAHSAGVNGAGRL
ncbi:MULTISPECIES: hypothetical protein [unclassified Mesorhizobium]|uniref:hypothetical protein n=1 Tax=unclassified Mesorhizobium TaxID=325217 RepID=UPI0003FF0003|nr:MULTISPECIES: hypothetical protein [unclassified Mesorhizobium]WJI63584.1 hypothetical protein NLY43_02015 [Mesorhizobium sp. C416B]WJI79216.1 hypothetical protein NLY34_20350 [Mesorhizobium sp. C374B]WJI85751.1 hypothetical protein NLY42_22750 [Mesorhizobium sp. C372A]